MSKSSHDLDGCLCSRARILILRDDGIGDVLNATPAISALRDAYRDAHISVLVRPPGAEVLLLNPHIDEVLVYSTASKLRFLKQLRAGHYDIVVVLHNSSWCNLLAYISGARYRIGRRSGRKKFSFTLTHGVTSPDPKGTKHEIDRNMDVVSLAGARNSSRELVLRLSEKERAWAQDFLRRHGVAGDRVCRPLLRKPRTGMACRAPYHPKNRLLVGIHPGGSSFDKLWPAENFARVADQLIQRYQAIIILFNGPGEITLTQNIQSNLRPDAPVIIPASQLNLRQFAALVEKCSLFLCNDSGPMHIAAALRVPTVAVFGPTDHVRWRPRNEKAVVVRKNMDCWPCSAHKCKRGFECIKSLPVDDVLNAAHLMLDIYRL